MVHWMKTHQPEKFVSVSAEVSVCCQIVFHTFVEEQKYKSWNVRLPNDRVQSRKNARHKMSSKACSINGNILAPLFINPIKTWIYPYTHTYNVPCCTLFLNSHGYQTT